MYHLPSASSVNREDGLLPLIPATSAKLARRLHISVVFGKFSIEVQKSEGVSGLIIYT